MLPPPWGGIDFLSLQLHSNFSHLVRPISIMLYTLPTCIWISRSRRDHLFTPWGRVTGEVLMILLFVAHRNPVGNQVATLIYDPDPTPRPYDWIPMSHHWRHPWDLEWITTISLGLNLIFTPICSNMLRFTSGFYRFAHFYHHLFRYIILLVRSFQSCVSIA